MCLHKHDVRPRNKRILYNLYTYLIHIFELGLRNMELDDLPGH